MIKNVMLREEEVKRLVCTDSIPLDRLEAICNAEREGRCVVLPCKVGDMVFDFVEFFGITEHPEFYEVDTKEITITRDKQGELEFTIDCNDYSYSDFGSTVFTSIGAAEEALKERGQNG